MFKFLIPAVAGLSFTVAVCAQNAGVGEYEALAEARRAYELIEELSPKDDRQLAAATLNYGRELLRVYQLQESSKVLKLALKRYETLYGKNSPELISALLLLAQAEGSYPQMRPNKRHLNRARKIATENLDNASIEFADQILTIGQLSLYARPPDIAGTDIHMAYEIYLSTLGPEAMKTGVAAYALGQYYLDRNEPDEASRYLESALGIFDPSDTSRREWHIAVRAFWAGTLEEQGMRDDATVHYVAIGKLLESSASEKLLPMYRVAPEYPSRALKSRITGYVDWRFTVDESGYVINPEVIEIQGSEEFIKASLDALLKFRYPPRFIDGHAVAEQGVTNRISFMFEN